MNVELSEGEARMILDVLSQPAAVRFSPVQAAVRASIKRKVRLALGAADVAQTPAGTPGGGSQ